MTPSHPPAPLPRSLVLLLALASGQAVAGTFYAQPLLDAIAASFGIGAGSAGAVIAVTQVGYAVGLVLLVPLGDVVERRHLILLQLVLGALALAAVGAAGSGMLLLVAVAGVGLFAVVIQLVVVHAASLTPAAQRGQVVGAVTSGVVLGILQARALAGPVSELGSWRTVYLTAAGLTLLVTLVLLRRLPTGEHKRTAITYGAVLGSLPALYAGERSLRVRGALALLVFAALSAVWSSLVLPLTATPHSLSHAAVGLFGLTAIAGAIAARRAGRLADRGRGEHTTGIALGLLVVAWLPLALIEWSLAAVAVGLVLVDLAVQAVHVTNQSTIYAARPEARSRLAGAYMLFYSAGIAGGSSPPRQPTQRPDGPPSAHSARRSASPPSPSGSRPRRGARGSETVRAAASQGSGVVDLAARRFLVTGTNDVPAGRAERRSQARPGLGVTSCPCGSTLTAPPSRRRRKRPSPLSGR